MKEALLAMIEHFDADRDASTIRQLYYLVLMLKK